MKIEVGKIYTVNHSRKGSFVARIEEVSDRWITVTLIEGYAHTMNGLVKEGESVHLRAEFCTFTPPPL